MVKVVTLASEPRRPRLDRGSMTSWIPGRSRE